MSDVIAFLVEPLGHGFMLRALLVSAGVGAVAAILSCYMVLRGWSLVADAISHALLPGVIVAYLIGIPLGLGGLLAGAAAVAAAGGIAAASPIKRDAALGIAFTGCFALGLVLLVATPSNLHFQHVLFGNVLGIEDDDLWQVAIAGTLVLAAIAVLRRDLLLLCFDPAHAQAIGLRPKRLELIFLLLVALTVVSTLQVTGVALAVTMCVVPGLIGFLASSRFNRVVGAAVLASTGASVGGVLLSYWIDAATGPCIALLLCLVFVLVYAVSPRGLDLAAGRPAAAPSGSG